MSKAQAISLRARWLGERLRAERSKAGYTLRDASEYLQIDFTSLGRFERGTHRIRSPYIRDLINFYGISNRQTRDALLKLNEDSWRKDWWDCESDDLETDFVEYAWLEARAVEIHHFELTLVPGLVQTEDYAKAVMRVSGEFDESAPDLERLLELRMKRQEAVLQGTPTPLRIILDESALRRKIGSVKVLRGQMNKLLEAAQQPHIDLRVRLTEAAWQPGLGSSFAYFKMDDPYPDVAYAESLIGRTFLEEEHKVKQLLRAWVGLHKSALSTKKSVGFIRKMIEELK